MAFIVAVVVGGFAWHFSSREAAYWGTDEQITETELRRAGMFSDVFGCAAAVAGVSAVGFTVLCVRARMLAVAHCHFLRCAVFVVIVCSACIAHHFSEWILGMDAYYPAERIVRFIAHELCAIGFVPVLVISVLLGMLAAALIGRSRERDA